MALSFVQKKCPVCGVDYCLEKQFDDYRLGGGKINGEKANWHCPNGHSLIYTESEADRLRRERDRLKQREAQLNDEIKWQRQRREAAERSASAYKGQTTKLRKRVKAGTCPCCNRTFQQLARHMATQHPTFTPTPPEPPEGITVQ